MLTLTVLLALAAFIATLASWGWNKPALHLAVLLLCILELIQILPIGK